jgi:hypothetical protein
MKSNYVAHFTGRLAFLVYRLSVQPKFNDPARSSGIRVILL